MPTPPAIDPAQLSAGLGLASTHVSALIELLDAGNTVPFITRYRKDQTGGMDEEQIRQIQSRLIKQRLLVERKQTILRSIESQGKLTPELAAAIEAADTTKRLEDLYLPFKPKKQTLATTARQRGLEPLATEILTAAPAALNLDARAADFINVDKIGTDKKITNAADALLGAGHILAEWFSERADVRGRLRVILERSGRLVTSAIEPEPAKNAPATVEHSTADEATAEQAEPVAPAAEASVESATTERPLSAPVAEAAPIVESAEAPTSNVIESESVEIANPTQTATLEATAPSEAAAPALLAAELETVQAEAVAAEATPAAEATVTGEAAAAAPGSAPAPTAARRDKKKNDKKKKKKAQDTKKLDQKRERLIKSFRDYFKFSEALGQIPPHRILAINRGERARILRVKVEYDLPALEQAIDELLVTPDHPHAEFIRGCGRDALARLILPGLERELRRELTDQAEWHAVDVFARNLRKLLLQPPVRERRLLAVDPGFKSGCKVVALDEFGNLLAHGLINLLGKDERLAEARAKLVALVKDNQLSVIAIGNGTACRETEKFVADVINNELAELKVAYVIVNEAGASVYSTSRLGREELPGYDATLRGAISIGRRLQDPLSELVKIDPANIGVGMYQHDVKAKHLRESLDAVVESCVNYVGVDLNTASPALLRYVSGLNQLTAQRLYDFRRTNGPFRNREQLKGVTGFGEATFVQAAGFLKIGGGDNPLDATWIHPESYPATTTVLEKLGSTPSDLADREKVSSLAQRTAELQVPQLAADLKLGTLTLTDILAQLARPGRDPRESLPPPIFKHGILKLDDLAPGMELAGTVLNVVDFGAFVDIGLKDSGLVHISQLANHYVQDPHSVVSVGDIVKVWVLEVDKQRRRVSLTMIEPGTRKPQEGRRPARPAAQPAEGAPAGGAPRPQGRRPQRQDQPSGTRPPSRGKGKPQYAAPKPQMPKPKPKPLVPLTDEMKKGKEPLRTFGDLKQFLSLKPDEPPAEEAS